MAINEEKVTGRKFRKLVNEAQKLWQRISFWTAACDVEFEDGKNLEEKFNALNEMIKRIEGLIESRLDGLTFRSMKQSEYDTITPDDKTVYFVTPDEKAAVLDAPLQVLPAPADMAVTVPLPEIQDQEDDQEDESGVE